MEKATEWCFVKTIVPKFSIYIKRLLKIFNLQTYKSLVFHCCLLVSNKDIFTHLVTLVNSSLLQ